jgi:hypothetical protein
MGGAQKLQFLLTVLTFGCSQGPSWVPPDGLVDGVTSTVDGGVAALRQGAEPSAPGLELLMPAEGQSCARVGEFVHLQALVAADDPVVKWTFQRDKDGCSPIPLVIQDASKLDANGYALFTWSTSCALDIPDDCGVGAGEVAVEVTDRAGNTEIQSVAFCLDEPDGV